MDQTRAEAQAVVTQTRVEAQTVVDQTRAQAQAEVTQVRAEANQAVLHTRAAAQEEVVAAQRTTLERIALLEQELLQSRREREESNRRIEQLIAERRLADDYWTRREAELNQQLGIACSGGTPPTTTRAPHWPPMSFHPTHKAIMSRLLLLHCQSPVLGSRLQVLLLVRRVRDTTPRSKRLHKRVLLPAHQQPQQHNLLSSPRRQAQKHLLLKRPLCSRVLLATQKLQP